MSSSPSPSSVRSGAPSTSSANPPPWSPQPERPKQPDAVKRPEVEAAPLTPPCCVIRARSGDTCERRFLSTAGELEAEIGSGLSSHKVRVAVAATNASIAAMGQQDRSVDGEPRPLIMMRGLPAPFLPILLGSPLGIDPDFVEAHAAGRSYRPLGVHRGQGRQAARYACWEYPELVTGFWQAFAQGKGGPGFGDSHFSSNSLEDVVELARQPVVRPVSDMDMELAAVFCRASLWVSQDVDVLFLDKPCWGQKGPLRKARRTGKVTKAHELANQEHLHKDRETKSHNLAVTMRKGDEIPSLDSILQDSLTTTYKDGGVSQALEETAYEQWLELFEILSPRQRVIIPEEVFLEWRIMQALERNLDMSKSLARRQNGGGIAESTGIRPDDWAGLIQRLRARVEILATMSPGVTHKTSQKTISGAPVHEEKLSYVPRHRPAAGTPPSPSSDENQRSLDRVTYLGGILLPFSVVSGVLSMNEDFEPGRPLFWVFWVATIPLALFTVLVIYADKLRQVEVWAEVPPAGGSVSEDAESTGGRVGSGEKVQEAEKLKDKKYRPTRVFGASKHSMRQSRRQQPEVVSYSAAGDVVIDLGSPTPEIQEESVEAPELNGDYRRTDDNQDQEWVSSDEAEEVVVVPISAEQDRHHRAWKKQQLGWGGAAMCMLKGKKPLRVSDGMPGPPREEQSTA
ncbi:hypothetical protein Daus18300_007328 [Diaporthe australafricana]|uniref:Uncharacterized protein n=1 Tax=Diaporthe australafricana TaxID=127596 RepID=A0ABR3WNI1_9PEZI